MATQQKPVHKIRAGTVSCAIWQNEIVVSGRKVVVLKASVERRYKDASGEWKSGTSLSRNEIPLAVYCLQKAFEHIIERSKADGDEVVVEEDMDA